MKLLFVDSCDGNAEISRTKKLCEVFIENFKQIYDCDVEILNLAKLNLKPLSRDKANFRIEKVKEQNFDDCIFDLPKQFLQADFVLIGAPYWDLSFPSILKTYFEYISCAGLTYNFGPNGVRGNSKAKKLFYITTSGGFIEKNLGFEYAKSLGAMFGVKEFECVKAEGLDIVGANVEKILENTTKKICKMIGGSNEK